MQMNQFQQIKTYYRLIALIGWLCLFPIGAYAQESPVKTIQEVYSFYQPRPDGSDVNGLDLIFTQNNRFFSPDFFNVMREDTKLTSAYGDCSIMDYDFICNCQDTMDGIIVRSIKILEQTPNTARIKVSFDFILNGSDNTQKDELFSNDHPGQQQTYFNLIHLQNHWLIDDVTDAQNVGIKKRWKEDLRKYYHSSIQSIGIEFLYY